ncbi:YbhN family protein [Kitasatospora sp. NPDC052896]|uniref:YbhN family protein n=1 Tax=Kitasatospora sp. NPDC052896 TaxID=3364061 RepID=UPI0037C5E9A5
MTTGISERSEAEPEARPAGQPRSVGLVVRTGRAGLAGRLRPRTLITVAGAVVFGVLLYFQGTRGDVDPVEVVLGADPGWVLLALLAAAASYPAAALGFLGFVPERLGAGRTVLVQLSGAFVKLVAPGGLGGMALNTRFLQRAGVAPGEAVSSVGVGSLVGLGLHLLQLMLFVSLLGFDPAAHQHVPWPVLAIAAGALVLLVAGVLAAPTARRWVLGRLRTLLAGSLSRLRDLSRQPGRLAAGVIGQLLVSMTLVSCLYCSVRAGHGHPRFAAVAVAYLVGSAIGSASPTPAGLLAVESSTAALLTAAASLGHATALGSVVLFRLITLVLPVFPGWLSLTRLQRAGAL